MNSEADAHNWKSECVLERSVKPLLHRGHRGLGPTRIPLQRAPICGAVAAAAGSDAQPGIYASLGDIGERFEPLRHKPVALMLTEGHPAG